ncbi:MAG TPA: efflux RND transporter periplasmic adaptor subunit [Caulobacteraceae bacterium]
MRWKSNYVFIVAVVAVLLLFFVMRGIFGGHDREANATENAAAARKADPLVQTALIAEQVKPYAVVMRGRTEAARTVVVRAETAGVVAAVPAREGAMVGRGAVLCRLEVDSRQATLDQARANQKSRELQRQASAKLAEKGYRSPTQVLQDQANLDAASAAVRQAEVALEQINVRAPFSGVFDHRDAEIGTYLSPGQPCGTVIELSPLLVVGDVSESEIASARVGAPAVATLVSGETLSGRVRYVARDADPQTRTYRVEIEAANPGLLARSGMSAEVRLNAGAGPAHLIPETALVLDSAGRQGVRYVLPDNRVGFAPVRVIDEAPQGVWVIGLRGPVRLITVGQSYVSEGQKVRVASR